MSIGVQKNVLVQTEDRYRDTSYELSVIQYLNEEATEHIGKGIDIIQYLNELKAVTVDSLCIHTVKLKSLHETCFSINLQ